MSPRTLTPPTVGSVPLPTFRRLSLGEAIPGRLVEYLGETQVAWQDLAPNEPVDESKLICAGHPGRVDRDWEAPYGGHVVVKWFGIEDTEESSTSSGYGWDEVTRTYPGLGWIDRATYDERTQRLVVGRDPLASSDD
jgi:hypothetical protein